MSVTYVRIPFVVEAVNSSNVVEPVSNASVTITERGGGTVKAAAYENGTGTASAVTQTNGGISGWLPEGRYTISIVGGDPTITATEYQWDAVSASETESLASKVSVIEGEIAGIKTSLKVSGELEAGSIKTTGTLKASALKASDGITAGSTITASGAVTAPTLAGELTTGPINIGGAKISAGEVNVGAINAASVVTSGAIVASGAIKSESWIQAALAGTTFGGYAPVTSGAEVKLAAGFSTVSWSGEAGITYSNYTTIAVPYPAAHVIPIVVGLQNGYFVAYNIANTTSTSFQVQGNTIPQSNTFISGKYAAERAAEPPAGTQTYFYWMTISWN